MYKIYLDFSCFFLYIMYNFFSVSRNKNIIQYGFCLPSAGRVGPRASFAGDRACASRLTSRTCDRFICVWRESRRYWGSRTSSAELSTNWASSPRRWASPRCSSKFCSSPAGPARWRCSRRSPRNRRRCCRWFRRPRPVEATACCEVAPSACRAALCPGMAREFGDNGPRSRSRAELRPCYWSKGLWRSPIEWHPGIFGNSCASRSWWDAPRESCHEDAPETLFLRDLGLCKNKRGFELERMI